MLLAGVEAVPEVDHLSVSLINGPFAARTVASTGEVPDRLDVLQYALAQGPAIDAITADDLVVVDPRAPQRWPEFMERATPLGMRAALAVRLEWDGKRLGSLNAYSLRVSTLSPEAVQLAVAFAAHASTTLGFARRSLDLEQALVTRQEIGQAVGVLMERYDLTSVAAFNYLRRVSQERNVKLRDVAAEMLAARERPTPTGRVEPT